MKKFLKNNILYLLFAFIFILIIFLSIINYNKITFLLCSILTNLFLIILIKEICKKLKIKFSKLEIITMLISIGLIFVFYFFSIHNRQFIYYWDYACYYNIGLDTINSFNNGLISGIKNFLLTTWSGEYGNFLSFIPHIIFNFTNKSIDSYLLSIVITTIPYLIISFSILIKTLSNKFKIKYNHFFISSISIFTLFPIVHAMFLYGQPDLFGLVFVFLIFSLTFNYDFKAIDYKKFILIILTTLLLIITRRWYIYFIISYYTCYALSLLINNFKDKKELMKIIKNGLIFSGIMIFSILITLLPLIKNIILASVGDYSYYMSGGLKTEFINQINHLGYIPLLIIISGIIYGIKNKKYRVITISHIIMYLIIIVLFTKIQNMGLHHSLLFVYFYMYFIMLFINLIINTKRKSMYCCLLIGIFIVNFICGYTNYNNKLFTDVGLKVSNDKNYNELGKVYNYLDENLNKNNTAYMITHNNMFNPDKLRNYKTPNNTVSYYLPYGSAVIGVHKFPLELLTSKYVITTTPFECISVECKYNEVFDMIKNDKFKLIKTFNMKDNYKLLIYERIKEVDNNEIDLYKNSLKNEIEKYPDLYDIDKLFNN